MDLIATLIIIGTLNALYFLPSLIANSNTNDFNVMLVNLFFGWTFIGWIIALVMATNGQPKKEVLRIIKSQREEINKLKGMIYQPQTETLKLTD